MIALAVLTDGREPPTLFDTMRSVDLHLPKFNRTELFDDSEHAFGLAGNVQRAWRWAVDVGADYLWHQEDDWTFTGLVPLGRMIECLQANPQLAQMCLKRQPVNPEEIAAGGFMELAPGQYIDQDTQHGRYTVHRRCFSLNPCVIPRRVLELGWPDTNEAGMTEKLLDLGFEFAVWGSHTDPPRVMHIGHTRATGWSL